jgi:hypothetical protein
VQFGKSTIAVSEEDTATIFGVGTSPPLAWAYCPALKKELVISFTMYLTFTSLRCVIFQMQLFTVTPFRISQLTFDCDNINVTSVSQRKWNNLLNKGNVTIKALVTLFWRCIAYY